MINNTDEMQFCGDYGYCICGNDCMTDAGGREMSISDEALAAALDALLAVFQQGANGGVYIQENSATHWVVDGICDLPLAVRKALEAAAPHLAAGADG